MRIQSWRTFFLLFISFPVFTFNASANKTEFEQAFNNVAAHWNLNGAIAGEITDDGSWKFYTLGYADSGQEKPVTLDNTVFAIASTTKAMVAAGILILQDDGLLQLDDPVIKHIPEFQLDSPLTPMITIRDLITHKVPISGVVEYWDWYYQWPVEKQIKLLKKHGLAGNFRDDFHYQNITFNIAGYLIERVSGKPWEQFLTERLWQPIGMNHTYGSRASISARVEVSDAVFHRDGQYIQYPDTFATEISNGAGSAWSTARDISRWLGFLLGDGTNADGVRVLSEASMEEFFTPQFINKTPPFYYFAELIDNDWETYSLGWLQMDYKAHKVDYHSGSVLGFSGMFGLIRDNHKAMFFFTNTQRYKLEREVMLATYLDQLDGELDHDWIASIEKAFEPRLKADEEFLTKLHSVRDEETSPTFELSTFTGTYESDEIGQFTIHERDGQLWFSMGKVERPLKHWQHNQFFYFNTAEEQWPNIVQFQEGVLQTIGQARLNEDTFKRLPDS